VRGARAAAQASGRGGKGRLCWRSGHGGQWRSSVQAGGQTGSGVSGAAVSAAGRCRGAQCARSSGRLAGGDRPRSGHGSGERVYLV